MSTVNAGWRGPNIVKEGLVLYLDAASGTSYSPYNSGTTWKDISGNNNNGTLTNGPVYNTANGGSFVFDGTNDYTSLSTFIIPTASFSCESFFQWANIGSDRGSIFSLNYNFPTSGYLIRQRDDSSGKFVVWSDNGAETNVFSTTALTANTWNNVAVIQTQGTCSIYINGILDSSQALQNPVLNQSYPILLGTRAFSGGSAGAYLTGRISIARLYNRALSAQEVLQNYNATKGRFGL